VGGAEGGVRSFASRGDTSVAKKPSSPERHQKPFLPAFSLTQVEFDGGGGGTTNLLLPGGGGGERTPFSYEASHPRMLCRVQGLRGQSRIRYSLPPPEIIESGIHLASATGKPLGFL